MAMEFSFPADISKGFVFLTRVKPLTVCLPSECVNHYTMELNPYKISES